MRPLDWLAKILSPPLQLVPFRADVAEGNTTNTAAGICTAMTPPHAETPSLADGVLGSTPSHLHPGVEGTTISSQHSKSSYSYSHSHSHSNPADSRISTSSSRSVRTTKSSRSTRSTRSHQEYLDSLPMPTPAMVEKINQVQEKKEEEGVKMRLSTERPDLNEEERDRAAALIQRSYRGHRERRILKGMGLDPGSRWVEAVKEAKYRNATLPRAREIVGQEGGEGVQGLDGTEGRPNTSKNNARQNWKKVALITRRAGGDEDSDSSGSEDYEGLSEHQREVLKRRRAEEKMERRKAAKLMDLQYFLEMVDVKHRYGSNLRTYHETWKKADTKENFFYWLDYGEGRYIDCPGCSRERLDKEQVRYLSKEERMDYLVKIDKEGRLCWAKNGARIDTTEQYKDSIHGIVPATDDTPAYTPAGAEAAHSDDGSSISSTSSSDDSNESEDEAARADKYATPEFDNAKGMKKVKHVSAATIFNKLLRGSVKKNTWIFVADTSFRLYVGIKQSGAFQHSSFLHGSRISAAGLVKIKNGRLSKLSPLSGHYRPPVKNFRAFVHSLKDAGADMSHVSISRSYAVLVGLEAYVKTRRRGKKFLKKLIHHRDKILSPDELAAREEAERDKSESAERERKFLELKQKAEEEEREKHRADIKFLEMLHLHPKAPLHSLLSQTHSDSHPTEQKMNHTTSLPEGRPKEKEPDPDIQAPGTGPENAIAPEGSRNA